MFERTISEGLKNIGVDSKDKEVSEGWDTSDLAMEKIVNNEAWGFKSFMPIAFAVPLAAAGFLFTNIILYISAGVLLLFGLGKGVLTLTVLKGGIQKKHMRRIARLIEKSIEQEKRSLKRELEKIGDKRASIMLSELEEKFDYFLDCLDGKLGDHENYDMYLAPAQEMHHAAMTNLRTIIEQYKIIQMANTDDSEQRMAELEEQEKTDSSEYEDKYPYL